MSPHKIIPTVCLAIAMAPVAAAGPVPERQSAGRILAETGVKGGLIVHVGCGDGTLTATLRANDSYVVHGLDRDPESIAAARGHIQSLGLYGSVSIDQWSGDRLPYIDNSVNLVVSEDLGGVSNSEVMRVLVPNGVAYAKSKGSWAKVVKPRPAEIDEWTHYLHDPSNNAVAHDSVIKPPSRYQWVAGPRYSRQHDHMSSVSAVVSAGGRLFYIFDEAPRASILTPPKWRLIARDAFNGTLLWKREIEVWHQHLWRLKSGPQLLARRLVAAGDRLYVTLGIDAPLSVLDAATGKTIRTYDGTKVAEEVLCSDDTLILSVAGGKLFVASVDAHSVHALDSVTGERLWSFTAGGCVDSPPTIWRGRALFGSADGHVYCLSADDGRLVWRYRAAPENQRMMAFEQVESVWPVHGSVLVQNDVLYCVAGRSMFLDGGLRLLRLDPKTGRKLSETILDDKDPDTRENLQVHIRGLNMPVALPDILSSDGKYVYMRSLPFDLEGNRKFVAYVPVKEQQGDDLHLFCPTGFLDDSLWHRTFWGYGRAWASGAGGYHQAGRVIPAGRPLVFDDKRVYGYGRLWKYYRWTTPLEFHLFAANKQPEIVNAGTERKPIRKGKKRGGSRTLSVTRFVPHWSDDVSVQVNSMVLAENSLFAAGPPDVEDEEESVKSLLDAETQKKLAEQSAAFEGKRGALLVAVSRDGGKKLAAYRLDFVPRFDGLIAANGRLYVSTLAGEVICLSGAGQPLPPAEDVVVSARK